MTHQAASQTKTAEARAREQAFNDLCATVNYLKQDLEELERVIWGPVQYALPGDCRMQILEQLGNCYERLKECRETLIEECNDVAEARGVWRADEAYRFAPYY